MLDRIEMSEKEIRRFELLRQVMDGVVSQQAAAQLLELSVRHVRRLQRWYESEGAVGLVSRRRGKQSNRRLCELEKARILLRVQERYADFGPSLAAEYLRTDGFAVSRETLRGWLIEAGLWQVVKKRRQRLHPLRPRRSRRGELAQIDGSAHDWFEGRGSRCTLIAFIDDASSQVLEARFVPTETSLGYLDCLRSYVERHGCPVAVYSDRHSIFGKHDPEDEDPTQFQRALGQLGIVGIRALTPQATGRVERLFQTLQDRLVKALRLHGISDLMAANALLPDYLESHNTRFAVAPESVEDAHAPYGGDALALARICALHERRKISKDLLLSFRRQRYILQTEGRPCYALRGETVTVVIYPDQRVELLRGKEILPFKILERPRTEDYLDDAKTLNARVDEILKPRRWSEKSRPAPNHPWRRYLE